MEKKTMAVTVLGGVLPASSIALIAAAGLWFGGSKSAGFSLDGLPESTVDNYRFAESHTDVLSHLPCYCGCYGLGHQSLVDCFLRPEGGYEMHASGCDICGREVDDVASMLDDGADVHAVRAAIGEKYARYGAPTNTP